MLKLKLTKPTDNLTVGSVYRCEQTPRKAIVTLTNDEGAVQFTYKARFEVVA